MAIVCQVCREAVKNGAYLGPHSINKVIKSCARFTLRLAGLGLILLGEVVEELPNLRVGVYKSCPVSFRKSSKSHESRMRLAPSINQTSAKIKKDTHGPLIPIGRQLKHGAAVQAANPNPHSRSNGYYFTPACPLRVGCRGVLDVIRRFDFSPWEKGDQLGLELTA